MTAAAMATYAFDQIDQVELSTHRLYACLENDGLMRHGWSGLPYLLSTRNHGRICLADSARRQMLPPATGRPPRS